MLVAKRHTHSEKELGMSHQDRVDRCTTGRNLEDLFQLLLPQSAASCPRHGNAKISPLTLASIAIACWGWSAQRTLTQRVQEAAAAVKHLCRPEETITRQGLLKALAHCGQPLAAMVAGNVYAKLRHLKGHWVTAGKATFAVDGTKFAAPRTRQNQQQFACTKNGTTNRKGKKYQKASDAEKAKTVQVLLTVFWHIGSGLPACWRITNSHGSERKLAEDMLGELPAGARVVGDAEYVGYPLWSAIVASRRSFLVRVGSNITLIKKLDPQLRRKGDLVHFWPEAVRKRGEPPLVLRLLEVQTSRGSMWLLSNEFDLSDVHIRELYRARWGIEVFFRTVKQNCRRAKLQCLTPINVQTELTWTLLGIWASLFAAKQALRESHEPITKLSPIRVMDKLAQALTQAAWGITAEFYLTTCLKPDESNRKSSKRSRSYPRKKKHIPCGSPQVRDATLDEIQMNKQLVY